MEARILSDTVALTQQAINLSALHRPGIYMVTKTEGTDPELRRLNQIGLIPGMRVEAASCPSDGMMVLKIGGGRLALSRGAIGNVWVRFRKPL